MDRDVQAKDCDIERISAKNLTSKSFQETYVDNNIPVIITDLILWNSKECSNDINGIDECLHDEHLLQNVFISTNQQNRFLYFDQDGDDNNKNEKKTQIRRKMKWKEFKQRILQKNNGCQLKPYLAEDENYYLYGEKVPNSLKKHVKIPSFIPAEDCLLWISSNRTCSPLHFDFCEGFLCQIAGIKRVCLFEFNADKFESFYPFPLHSKHKRQSMIDDIHQPNMQKFELFAKDKQIKCFQGTICQNEGLFIPFSWWHQIEADDECGSISLSFRWNPYLNHIKNAILTSSRMKNTLIGDIIFNECISKLPFYVKNAATVWRQIFDAKQNENVQNEDEEKKEADIDLFDVD